MKNADADDTTMKIICKCPVTCNDMIVERDNFSVSGWEQEDADNYYSENGATITIYKCSECGESHAIRFIG